MLHIDYQYFLYGQEVHDSLKSSHDRHWILNHHEIQTNLINFYGEYGKIEECEAIFECAKNEERNCKDINIWNAMIHSYGICGKIDKARELFDVMKAGNFILDKKTYIHLLNAYSHSGDADEGIKIWKSIIDEEIKYDEYVMSVIIDCMSRKGYLKQAFEYLIKYDIDNEVAWISLMSGCKQYSQKEIATNVFQEMNKKFNWDSDCVSAACHLFPEFNKEFACKTE